jgi:hypothetical protein
MKRAIRVSLLLFMVGIAAAFVCRWSFVYADSLQTIETLVEIGILLYMVSEAPEIKEKLGGIYNSTATVPGSTDVTYLTTEDGETTFGTTEDLKVGSRVFVLRPEPGVPRDKWQYDTMVWIIREVDKEKGRALATPVLAPPTGPTPTVSGPISGPLSPFKKANVAG